MSLFGCGSLHMNPIDRFSIEVPKTSVGHVQSYSVHKSVMHGEKHQYSEQNEEGDDSASTKCHAELTTRKIHFLPMLVLRPATRKLKPTDTGSKYRAP